ncbi:MAG TPA: hypothetical protein VIK32_10175 [Candidatus Limnocylindrales bacterium]|jgi:hypothetical protein
MKARIWILLGIVALVICVIVLAVATASSPPSAGASGIVTVDQVPPVIPASGVTFAPSVADIILMPPLAKASQLTIGSAEAAIKAAPQPNVKLPATAVLASATVGATVPLAGESTDGYANIKDRMVWVVTWTLPEPVDVRQGGGPRQLAPGATPSPLLKSHFNMLIDAETGDDLWGFFTD